MGSNKNIKVGWDVVGGVGWGGVGWGGVGWGGVGWGGEGDLLGWLSGKSRMTSMKAVHQSTNMTARAMLGMAEKSQER